MLYIYMQKKNKTQYIQGERVKKKSLWWLAIESRILKSQATLRVQQLRRKWVTADWKLGREVSQCYLCVAVIQVVVKESVYKHKYSSTFQFRQHRFGY